MPARPYPIEIPPSTNGWSGYLITKGLCSADLNIDRKFKQHLQELRQQQQRHIHHHQTPHQTKNLSLIKSSSRHLSELSNYPSDFLLWGGPYLRKPVVSSSSTSSIQEPLDMSGSVLLAWANSPEEVKDVLQKDIFTKEKVWNWEEIRILPFKSTVRKAM